MSWTHVGNADLRNLTLYPLCFLKPGFMLDAHGQIRCTAKGRRMSKTETISVHLPHFFDATFCFFIIRRSHEY